MISIYLLFDCDTSISMILKFQFNNFEKGDYFTFVEELNT